VRYAYHFACCIIAAGCTIILRDPVCFNTRIITTHGDKEVAIRMQPVGHFCFGHYGSINFLFEGHGLPTDKANTIAWPIEACWLSACSLLLTSQRGRNNEL
jgi:hypothetical protein